MSADDKYGGEGVADALIIHEIWEAFPNRLTRNAWELLAGLLRGRQQHSLRDPTWWSWGPSVAATYRMDRYGQPMYAQTQRRVEDGGVLVLGELRCSGRGRLCTMTVMVAHVLEERCPPGLLALAARLLVQGDASPVRVSEVP